CAPPTGKSSFQAGFFTPCVPQGVAGRSSHLDGRRPAGEIGPQSPYRLCGATVPRARISLDKAEPQPLTPRSDPRQSEADVRASGPYREHDCYSLRPRPRPCAATSEWSARHCRVDPHYREPHFSAQRESRNPAGTCRHSTEHSFHALRLYFLTD